MTTCPYYKKCGGCQLPNLNYEEQLHMKQANMIKLLGRFGHVGEIIPMGEPYHYRNKAQSAFLTRNGKVLSGIYQSSAGKIVPVDSCLLEDEVSGGIIATVRKLCASFKLKPYDLETGRGYFRHVLIRRGFASGEIMVVLVTAEGKFPSARPFVNALLERHPEITTVVHNVNPTDTALLLGNKSEVLHGDGYIRDTLCGLEFRISPKSFYQVNPVQTEVLYGTALECAELTGTERVIDAYCGTGTIGLIMAKHAGEVYGVEVNRDAVADAKNNAKANGIKNARFFCDDAGRFMDGLTKERKKIDVVVTDPPRSGCTKKFLASIAALEPKRVVYISCNPETLARDLWSLKQSGYKAERIQPVDMFPHTRHVECVVLLRREKVDGRVKIAVHTRELK